MTPLRLLRSLICLGTTLLGAERDYAVRRAMKSVRGFAQDYLVDLTGLIADVLNGNLDAAGMASAHRGLLKQYAEPTYIEGMIEGGMDGESEARANMDAEDEATIAGWQAEQRQHVAKFALDTYAVYLLGEKAKRKGADDGLKEKWRDAQQAIYNRADMWADALETLGGLGRASARKNAMGTWRLGKTEEHCTTCSWLDGQRHRAKWFVANGYIPGENGSETLECGGWFCDCGVFDDEGKRIL